MVRSEKIRVLSQKFGGPSLLTYVKYIPFAMHFQRLPCAQHVARVNQYNAQIMTLGFILVPFLTLGYRVDNITWLLARGDWILLVFLRFSLVLDWFLLVLIEQYSKINEIKPKC